MSWSSIRHVVMPSEITQARPSLPTIRLRYPSRNASSTDVSASTVWLMWPCTDTRCAGPSAINGSSRRQVAGSSADSGRSPTCRCRSGATRPGGMP